MTLDTASPDQSSVLEQSDKFTPGPWIANDECVNSISVRDASGVRVAELMDENDEPFSDDEITPSMWANARLIAAAPDMLVALEMALHDYTLSDNVARAVEAAIAQAVGDRTDASAPSEGRLNQKPTAPGSA